MTIGLICPLSERVGRGQVGVNELAVVVVSREGQRLAPGSLASAGEAPSVGEAVALTDGRRVEVTGFLYGTDFVLVGLLAVEIVD